MVDLFYGTELDGRNEAGRQEREEKAKEICFSCEYRMPCLERAMVLRDENGVWGGMTEGERREFRRHMAAEGYGKQVPEGDEFWATLNSFYRAVENNRKRAS